MFEFSLLVALDLELLPHSRPVGAVECILIKPLDVETETAQRKQDTVKLTNQLLLFWRIVTWIPLDFVNGEKLEEGSVTHVEDVKPSNPKRAIRLLSGGAHNNLLAIDNHHGVLV